MSWPKRLQRSKPLQRDMGDEAEMEKYTIVKDDRMFYPMGVTVINGGAHFSVVSRSEACALVLFSRGRKKPDARLLFPLENRIGDVWNMTVSGDFTGIEDCYEMDGILKEDPYGKAFTGREAWGNFAQVKNISRARIRSEAYDWEGDVPLEHPYENSVIYRIHTRGFTKHPSSKVENRGYFAGIQEKIPY